MHIIEKRLKDSKVRRARLKKSLETSLTGIPAVKVVRQNASSISVKPMCSIHQSKKNTLPG